jgi:hypothetical protein
MPAFVTLKNVNLSGKKISINLKITINVMEDNTSYTENDDLIPHLKTMTSVTNKLVLDGYDDDFKIADKGLRSLKTENVYQPEDIKVVNFFRFEGQSDPNDQSILYVIETSDGLKGTLVDAYGPYSDRKLAEFIQQVEDFHKKTAK